VGHQPFLVYPHRHPGNRVLSSPYPTSGITEAGTSRPQDSLLAAHCQPGDHTPAPLAPLPLRVPSPGWLKSPHQRPFVGLPALELEDPPPLSPYRQPPPYRCCGPQVYHLHWRPVRVPMINADLVPRATPNLPPQYVMGSTYSALKKRVREALIEDWSRLFPPPPTITTLQPYTPTTLWGWESS